MRLTPPPSRLGWEGAADERVAASGDAGAAITHLVQRWGQAALMRETLLVS